MDCVVSQLDPFSARLAADGQTLRRQQPSVLQINVGKVCNQTCSHCHVDAGPHRQEVMSRQTIARILEWLSGTSIATVDITGGAPELNPHFEYLVERCRKLGRHVMDRCNLTVLLEPGKEQLKYFLKAQRVELVCSLPCYLEQNVDKQRGSGVFGKSLEALHQLNAVGYGVEGTGLVLDLVYNPLGTALPGPQAELEENYRRELKARYGIVFNRLWTITNMPISRFARYLHHTGQAQAYQARLEAMHRPQNVENVMCRTTVNVDWRGIVYDCDFNQMLEWPIANGEERDGLSERPLWEITLDELGRTPVRTGAHCFGCTAGHGSSCSGALGDGAEAFRLS